MMALPVRPFSSGSRLAPDPFDQFLDLNGFYRKHTPRDASCLFRVISEQMFDTQVYHADVRRECVAFMRRYKKCYQEYIKGDIDEYLNELEKPRTHAGFLEVRALAFYYGRNVLLFEQFNKGTWLIRNPLFEDFFRIFYTPENHFDTVFTKPYIENAAFCQSICYEILYSYVFKLPDVVYAVERMLHDPPSGIEILEIIASDYDEYPERLSLKDGRNFLLDRPDTTNCILDNYLLCHFHNKNFKSLANALEKEAYECGSNQDISKITKMIDSLLPEKYISCVRQLIDEGTGITPFPYKVAKALDPDIYRNIEFDSWSEMRKEIRLKNWYRGGNHLQVGVKCHVRLCKNRRHPYICHIQDMQPNKGPCLVFVEELGEKRTVDYAQLSPLPSDQIKAWTVPYRYSRPNRHKNYQKYQQKYLLSPKDYHNRHYIPQNCDSPKLLIPYNKRNKKNYKHCADKYNDCPSFDKHYDDYYSYNCSHVDSMQAQINELTKLTHFLPVAYDVTAMPVINKSSKLNMAANLTADGQPKSLLPKIDEEPSNKVAPAEPKSTTAASKEEQLDFDSAQNSIEESQYFVTNSPMYFYSSDYQQEYATLPAYIEPPNQHAPVLPHYNNLSVQSYAPSIAYVRGDQNSTASSLSPIPYPTSEAESSSFFNMPPPLSHTGAFRNLPFTSLPIKRKDLLVSSRSVNLHLKPSVELSGQDMPVNDLSSLRFFYNLGHEFFSNLQNNFSLSTINALTQAQHTQHYPSHFYSGPVRNNGGSYELLPDDNASFDTSYPTQPEDELCAEIGKINLDATKSYSHQSKQHDHPNRRYGYNFRSNKKDKAKNQKNATKMRTTVEQAAANLSNLSNNLSMPKDTSNASSSNSVFNETSLAINDSSDQSTDKSYINVPTSSVQGTEFSAPLAPPYIPLPTYIPYYQFEDPYLHGQYQAFGMYPAHQTSYAYALPPPPPSIHAHPGTPLYQAGPVTPLPPTIAADGSLLDGLEIANPQQFSYMHPSYVYQSPPNPHQQYAVAPQGFWYPPPPIPITTTSSPSTSTSIAKSYSSPLVHYSSPNMG